MPRRQARFKECESCGETYRAERKTRRYCSQPCARMAINDRLIKEAIERQRIKHSSGYWTIRLPDGSKVPEHRHVYEQSRGVKLQTWHYLRWINGNKLDNRPENLTLANPAMEAYVQRTGRLPSEMGRSLCPCGGKRKLSRQLSGQTRWFCSQCQEKIRKVS